jgi:serine/threonine-protein kinase RsbW
MELVSCVIRQVERADRTFHNEMLTAFGEAFNNVAIHGYRGRPDGMLDIEAEITPDGLTLRLSDTGKSIDFRVVESPDLDALPESGMGVFMIHSLVEEMRYDAGCPNVLTLVKKISSGGQIPVARVG